MNAASIELSTDQRAALDTFAESDSAEFALGGLAGTGKTVLVRHVQERALANGIPVAVVAPTAKACVELRRKGVKDPCTIHQAIYDFVGIVEREGGGVELGFELKPGGGKAERDPDLFGGRRRRGLVVCDEASMVNDDVARDLRSRSPSILWVGDHGQLQPVGRDPGIMSRLDFALERIHRQAAGSAIVRVAHEVRSGTSLADSARARQGEEVELHAAFNGFGVAELLVARVADVAIVARNATRVAVNAEVRRRLRGPNPPPLVAGDRVVGLANDYRSGVMNGETYDVTSVDGEDLERGTIAATLRRSDREMLSVEVWKRCVGRGLQGIEREAESARERRIALVDHAWALTAHKAQGSEWPSVVVFDERVDRDGWDMRRWWYTACTRAKERLVVASPGARR